MDSKELEKVKFEHGLWCYNDAKGVRANLIGRSLAGATFWRSNLRGAVFSAADLSGADFGGACLSLADMSGASLRGAILRGANLSGVNFAGADLTGADLSDANLSDTNLIYANMSDVALGGAVIHDAVGNNSEVKSLQAGRYMVTYSSRSVQFSTHTFELPGFFLVGDVFTNSLTLMEREWWITNKDWIIQAIKCSPAKPSRLIGNRTLTE